MKRSQFTETQIISMLKEADAGLSDKEEKWTHLTGQELDAAKWFLQDERDHEKTETQSFP